MSDVKAGVLLAMRETAVMFHEIVAPICRRHDVTVQQVLILAELEERPHQMAAQLADRVGIRRTNVAAVCCKMEAKGLILRQRSKTDRRCVRLDATQKGLELLEQVTEELGLVLDRGSLVMNEQDYADIRDGMSAFSKLMTAAMKS